MNARHPQTRPAMPEHDEVVNEPRRRGRPAGSGEQLPARERTRKSREERAKAGATRLDFTLDPDCSEQLLTLMEHWKSPNRKDAVQRALDIVLQTIVGQR